MVQRKKRWERKCVAKCKEICIKTGREEGKRKFVKMFVKIKQEIKGAKKKKKTVGDKNVGKGDCFICVFFFSLCGQKKHIKATKKREKL